VQPGRPRLVEPRRDVFEGVASLDAGEPERHHAVIHALDGDAQGVGGVGARARRVSRVVRHVEDPGDLDPKVGPRPRPPTREAPEIGGMRDTEKEVVRRRRERHLGVADVLARHLRPELVGDQLVVVGGAQAARDGDVDLDEVRKVAEGEPAAQALHTIRGENYAIAPGQFQQRGRLDRALQVDVQLRFGRGA